MRDFPEFPPKLTERQQQILNLIQDSVMSTGAPPTRAEIAASLGFKSANAAEEHLQALARKGAIELVSGTSRGIRLKNETLKTIHQTRLGGDHRSVRTNIFMVPLIGRVAAGSPIFSPEHIDQTYQIEAGLFRKQPDYLLKVKGLSMKNAGIFDGDLLAVESAQQASNGQIIVARLGDEVTVKRLEKNNRSVILHPENSDFNPIIVTDKESFSIEGIAIGLIRNFG